MGNKRKASLIIIVVILAALTVFSCVPFCFHTGAQQYVSFYLVISRKEEKLNQNITLAENTLGQRIKAQRIRVG